MNDNNYVDISKNCREVQHTPALGQEFTDLLLVSL